MARGVDFSEFKKWVQNYKNIINNHEVEEFLRNFLTMKAEDLIGRAKDRTPIKTGTLKASWQLGEIEGTGTHIKIPIENEMEYASYVEYGHETLKGEWVGGRYMLTVSMDEIMQEMDADFKLAFKAWAREKGLGD